MEQTTLERGDGGASCKEQAQQYFYNNTSPAQVEAPNWLTGYGTKAEHPMYTTTASSYGKKPPSVHTMPTQFYARSQKFSEHLGQCGMYRNFSLNTDTDKSKV